jgi:hypothetical protein
MSFTVPLPPRTQLYHRSCSNKHTHLLEASRTVLRGGELQMELVELFKYHGFSHHFVVLPAKICDDLGAKHMF